MPVLREHEMMMMQMRGRWARRHWAGARGYLQVSGFIRPGAQGPLFPLPRTRQPMLASFPSCSTATALSDARAAVPAAPHALASIRTPRPPAELCPGRVSCRPRVWVQPLEQQQLPLARRPIGLERSSLAQGPPLHGFLTPQHPPAARTHAANTMKGRW